MLSGLRGWRVSLRRARADWPIVAAASLTMVLATTLLASGPIYSSAVTVAGMRQLLSEASVEAGNVRVSAGVARDQVDAVDRAISAELVRVAGNVAAELARHGAAEAYALPGQGDEVRDLAQPAFAEGIEQHATLVAGQWPSGARTALPTDAGSPVPVAVSDAVADQLGLELGDRLDLVSRRTAGAPLPVTITAIFRIDEPVDPYWWADARTIDGLTESGQFRTFGPFFMARSDVLGRAATSNISFSWRLLPDYSGIAIDDVGGLEARLAALPDRLQAVAAAQAPLIDTDLPQTLAAASRALLVSRTGMLLLMGQLALLGGYSILLTAGLLIDHRRVETALLRARGAAPAQVAGLAVVEGLMLAIPAVVVGPWLAILALGLFDHVGPLADVGLRVPLRVTTDAYVAAALAGAGCVALLTVPTVVSARAFKAEQRAQSRGETRPLAQRLGIDLALVVGAAIALWQLRLYGAPLTRTVQGTLGPDPLLIAAPALGLVAGAVVSTRLLPRLAEGAEYLLARGRGLVGALGSFQLARRPLRYTRSALMLILAMSIGVFAVSYATTWTNSQRAQANHQVGADMRVAPSRSRRALPYSSLAAAYAVLPGVEQAIPVERHTIELQRGVRGTLLALDAQVGPGIVRFRTDQADAPLADMLAPLLAARPAPALAALPAGSGAARVAVQVEIRDIVRETTDAATGEVARVQESPAAFDQHALIGASVAVRDPHGVIHRFSSVPAPAADARVGIEIPLGGAQGPLDLVSIDVSVGLPEDLVVTGGSISVAEFAAVDPASATTSPLDLGAPDSWRMVWDDPASTPLTLPATDGAFAVAIGEQTGGARTPAELATAGTAGPVTISMQPLGAIRPAPPEVPVLASTGTLEAMGLGPADAFDLRVSDIELRARIAGVVESFPTTDASAPVIVMDLPTLALLRFSAVHANSAEVAGFGETRQPDEWWIDVAEPGEPAAGPAAPAELARTLAAPPFISSSVTTAVSRERSLVSDPVALGIIGALGLGALAAGLFALIGLAVAASVSARERQTEFALLRALGLSRRQLAGWLWLENGSLAVVSVLVGVALGALISLVVLPSVTLTASGLPPTPPVIVTLPLLTIAVVALIAAGALVLVVAVMTAVLRRMRVGNILRLGEE